MRATLGDGARVMPDPVMGSEDFAYFAQKVPSVYYWLGCRRPAMRFPAAQRRVLTRRGGYGAWHQNPAPRNPGHTGRLTEQILIHNNLRRPQPWQTRPIKTSITATPWDRDFWIIEESARVRCFLIIGSSDAMLVDTGLGQGDLREFVSTLTQLPIFVVNTHADIDHTGCNTQFEDVYMHPSDFFYHRARVNAPLSVKPIWDKDIITVGGRTFEVVHIPGHTPGSIALLDREKRLLIAGDSRQSRRFTCRQRRPRPFGVFVQHCRSSTAFPTVFRPCCPRMARCRLRPRSSAYCTRAEQRF
jgi:hypothetical protein